MRSQATRGLAQWNEQALAIDALKEFSRGK